MQLKLLRHLSITYTANDSVQTSVLVLISGASLMLKFIVLPKTMKRRNPIAAFLY